MSIYPAGYGLNKYDLFWGKIARGEFIRRAAYVSNATATLYTCPSNKRAYIVQLFVSWYVTDAAHVRVYITASDETKHYIVVQRTLSGNFAIYDVIPLLPGDSLSIDSTSTSAYGWITVYIVEV